MAEKSGRGADVGDDHAQIFGRDDFADQVLHLGDFALGDRQPRAGGRLQVDDELAGVRAREEGQPEQREHQPGCATNATPKPTSVSAGQRSDHADEPVVDLQEAIRSGC